MAAWWPFAYVFLASDDPEHRTRVATALLPAVVPVSGPARVGIAAVAADQTIGESERREQQVARETVTAVQAVASQDGGGEKQLTDADLDELNLRNLKAVIARAPDLREHVISAGSIEATNVEEIATETVTAVERVAQHVRKGEKAELTPDDVKDLGRLGPLITASGPNGVKKQIEETVSGEQQDAAQAAIQETLTAVQLIRQHVDKSEAAALTDDEAKQLKLLSEVEISDAAKKKAFEKKVAGFVTPATP